MNKILALIAIALLSTISLADNIEKLIPGKPIVKDWTETETLSCSDWEPNPSHYTSGTTFQQKSNCLVTEERYTQAVFVGVVSHEVKEKGQKVTESITVKKSKTRDEVGTYNPEFQLTVGTYYKEGKRYFGYINRDVRKAYKIADEDESAIESEGSLNKTEYKGYEISALFQNDTNFILVYDKKANDDIQPTIRINGNLCTSTEQYHNNGGWDIFYYKDCIDLSTSEKSVINLTIN